MSVSIFIQTLNEEINLPRCLKSVDFSDDVVVLDSFSEDGTEKIARQSGTRFYQREYAGRAANQNWAVENIDFKYPWVYYSDADEVVTPELAKEIVEVCSNSSRPESLFRVRFKTILMDRWIRHSSMYPTWVARLFRPEKIRWERPANPVAVVDGPEGKLKEHFLHYNFSKGVDAWLDKHRKYASYEAEETVKNLEAGETDWSGLLSPDDVRRRQALKKLSFRLPLRAECKFIYMYLLRLGFLDGLPGLVYCRLQWVYERMICRNVKQLRKYGK